MSKETIMITGSPRKDGGKDEETSTQDLQELAEHLIGHERAALDKWFKGDTSGYRDLWSKRDFSYFDGVKDNRVDTHAEISASLVPMEGALHANSYNFCRPRVLFGGDMAVFTYQLYADTTVGGKPFDMRYNCVEVFKKEPDGWHVVHSTWCFIKPMLTDFSALGIEEIL